MAENRFFILEDEEYDDVEPCIRDRTFKIKDIYGHYRYDDLEELCNELNRLNNENEELKEEKDLLFKQIKAFRDDCRMYNDFSGVSTLNELIKILEESMGLFEND